MCRYMALEPETPGPIGRPTARPTTTSALEIVIAWFRRGAVTQLVTAQAIFL